jgi:glycosyltransferase involved in cell wall biosynthesis
MSGFAVCSVVTYNHLHTALCLVRSIRRRWTTQPPVFIALVDHVDRPRDGIADVPGVEFIEARHLDVPNLDWQLCKLTAFEACCMLKPFLLRKLLERGFDTVLHVDSDIHFFADGMSFVDEIGLADILVTPHVMSPLPFNEPWTSVTMGQLAEAGVLNTGLVGVRNTSGARSFIDTWCRMCSGPGAFLRDLGNQNEQQHFNWVLAFSDNVRMCRDPRVNVAYWNLHERPIRWGGLDDRDRDLWYLGDQPITCFHFSGFDWDRGRLSVHDDRARPHANANLFALCEYYTQALAESDRARYESVPYEFQAVGEVELDTYVRTELKRSEARGPLSPQRWPEMGRAALEKLNGTLGSASLVPGFLEPIQQRADLTPFHDHLFSPEWIRWADLGLWRDHPVPGLVYEGFCPFVYHRTYFADLVREIRQVHPALEDSTIADLLKRGRPQLLQQLDGDALPDDVRHSIAAALYRVPAFVPAVAIRLLYAESAHLQEHFPDVAGVDFLRFRDWLASAGDVFDYPQNVRDFIPALDFERSMARVLGKSLRIPGLVEGIRRDGYNRAHLAALVGDAQHGCGYGADDLVIADWWLAHLGEAATRRIRALAPSEAGDVGFRDYLTAWCTRRGICDASTPPKEIDCVVASLQQCIVERAELTDVLAIASVAAPHVERARAALVPHARGINVFGYFRSPIGLGTATIGLCRALESAGYQHQDLVISNDALDADVTLDDLFQDFAFNYPRNIVVSYPHIEYQLQSVRPRCFFDGRETIGYFAWEQRDFPSPWADRLLPYDKLCALSLFSAAGIARGVNRPVAVLPCVVETGAPVPKATARARFGIPAGTFVVGYVFDAASSIERKNPLAVIDAVEKAFGRSRDVVLVLKIGSGRRPDFAPQIAEIERRMEALPGSIVIKDYLPRGDVEALICAMDVYLSLHRSEGFGYTLAEAMLLGIPAVATGYSGNLDFMTDDNSHLVASREVTITRREGPFESGTVWAEPDIDHAVEILRHIHRDYSAACQRAADAVAEVASVVSPAAVAESVAAVIDGTAFGAPLDGQISPPLMSR